MSNQDNVKINCILHGETARKFLKIKEAKGIEQNTEAIRLAVNEFFDKHPEICKVSPKQEASF